MEKLKCRYVIYFFCICCLFPSLLSSCKYDDSELIDRVDNLEDRLAKLEEQCKQINANINSLQTIVSALENANQITSVSELVENGKKVGYKIEFTKSDPIYIYHGQDGSDGSDGTDGYVPQIGVEKDKDGIYYWTLDGTWLTDKEGKKIKAVGLDGKDGEDGEDGADGSDGTNGSNGSNGRDGVTPKLRINEGNWEVSYNNGASWEVLGSATGGTTPSPITGVEVKDGYVIFTLSAGDEIQVPLFNGITITFDETEIGMEAGSKVDLQYELTGSDDVKVSAIGEGVRTSIDQTNKTLTITTDANFEGGKVLVHATDGNNVATVELTITKEVITYIEYEATEEISPFKSSETPIFGGKGVSFLKDKSTFSEGKGKWAFKGEVTYIVDAAFSGNTALESIVLPESITDIGYKEGGESGGGGAFEGCANLRKATINCPTLKVLKRLTFKDCSSLESITLPENLTTIEYNVFLRCEALAEIVIPDNVTAIGEAAFSQCKGLKNIVIGNGVETIDDKAFENCGDVETITLGTNVKSIGENTFNARSSWDTDYQKLKTITCLGETPATITNTSFPSPSTSGWVTYNYKIIIPSGAETTYKSEWSFYSAKITTE